MLVDDARAKRNVAVLMAAQAILGAQLPINFVVAGLAGGMVAGKAGSRIAASGAPVKRMRLTGGWAVVSVITAPRLTSEPVPLVEGMAIKVIWPVSRGGGL